MPRMLLVWSLVVLTACLLAPHHAQAQAMADYTAYPAFVAESVPPNILFVVDLSEAMLPASYGDYPESSGGKISSNVNGTGLCNTNTDTSTNPQPAGCPSVNEPADAFDSSKEYFGMFDSRGCYTYSNNQFENRIERATLNSNCNSSQWDGNFLNWLSMRKIDIAKKVLIGGRTLSASNNDGSANTLLGEQKTGSDGGTGKCTTSSSFCFRYVKHASGSGNRYPSTLPKDSGNVSYFGVGEGSIFVSSVASEVGVFGTSSANQFNIKLDLTTETDAYRKERSTGLLQNLNDNNMRIGVMFTNADNGKAARVFRPFDGTFNSSAITGIRNQQLAAFAALGEGTYEALCYYRNAQGPCYSNSPADFTASVGSQGDPYWFVSTSQFVPCCKSFILMVSSGVPSGDGSAPDLQQPFGNLFASDAVGLNSTWLDDVALYGRTNDIRGDLTGSQPVIFYSVNAMAGSTGAGVLASAAKFGGFEDINDDGQVAQSGQSCTYPAGSTLGSGTGTSSAEWDKDQDCIPDTYFEASQGAQLESTIKEAIADILKRAASGTSVSVLATSATGEGAIYQAFFFPSQFEGLNKITWTGYTQGLFIDAFGNLREDTDQDGRLVLENDRIVRTKFDTTTNEVKAERFADANGDGAADSSTPIDTVDLRELKPIWEAGRRLALTDPANRKLKTWVDIDNDGVVDSNELIDFKTTNSATLAPYLRAGAAPYTADNIINFIRGQQISGLRDRQLTVKDDGGTGVLKVWKYGDPVHSTPTIVAAPRERYDLLYGDASYATFLQQYKNRRQVAYVGANDGMLHAFNGGFYRRGDDSNTATVVEHGYFTRTPTDNSGGPLLGEELFGFIPQATLPHLQWLADPSYSHVYYVDLKPKVTDARIFAPDSDHPSGWGTILIGGMRFGGSCGACTTSTGGPPMTVTADFNNDGDTSDVADTRTFYTAYFALDVTNPESTSYGKLLWSFSQADLGLSTSFPAVLRVNPDGQAKTDNSQAKWYMLIGSGPTGYSGASAQGGKLFLVNVADGTLVDTFATADINAFMGDVIAVDADLDYRVDGSYLGNVIDNGSDTPKWKGKLYRMTTAGGIPTVSSWGVSGSSGRAPTVLLSEFSCSPTPSCTGPTKVGPIVAAPTATLDDANQLWVFFGSGRFFEQDDKSYLATQHFFGVKDPVLTGGCTQSTVNNCERKDLLDVSAAVVCVVCSSGTNQVEGVSGVSTFDELLAKMQGTSSLPGKNGWFVSLAAGERSLAAPTLLGGTVFLTSFAPANDLCVSSGDGKLYALFYKTGTAYKDPILGTETVGANENSRRSVDLGTGLPSQMAVQIGAQGSGGSGTTSSSGCAGRVTGFIQASTGALNQFCGKPALSTWSRYVSWITARL